MKAFKGRNVLITGNTGFKGSWLCAWLVRQGARVCGLSLDLPSKPSHYSALDLESRIEQVWGDVRDADTCAKAIERFKPEFVFHLAAQALVRRSYQQPCATIATNVMGTANILDALWKADRPCTAVIITSDKCYDNVEQPWGYRESDALGGKDPYSASKGAAELVIKGYAQSYFSADDSPVKIAVARAGNVIGGGDWAEDRIVPDCMRAWSRGTAVDIRYPQATRPWQHVLEPLSGYLTLATQLARNARLNGEPFNFGPPAHQNHTVAELLHAMQPYWPGTSWNDASQNAAVYEAGLLKLCCDKAMHVLGWRPIMDFGETVRATAEWYRSFYESDGRDTWDLTQGQIEHYTRIAAERGSVWA